jgi:hypothetical protein
LSRASTIGPALLNFISRLLQHPLEFQFLGLFAMNVVLQVLNHAVGVVKRAPQGL